jgi:hypothetical protein
LTNCGSRNPYVTPARANLETALSEALDDIKSVLNSSARFMVDQPRAFMYSDYGINTILSPGSSRIKEFDPFLFDRHFGRGFRGIYQPESGRIFLKEGSWCRHCLIHETLHSVSVFVVPQNRHVGDRYIFLREGLTEFLTGYVLWRKYTNCYNAWKGKMHPDWCALFSDYEEMARIWYTFCRFVPFEKVKKLFFGNSTTNWSRLWNEFLREINTLGYSFNDPMGGGPLRFQDRFLNECKTAFGRAAVERIHEMESSDFEYDKLL